MRDENYESKLKELQAEIKKSLGKIENPSEADVVIWGLSRKTWSHCEMALELIAANANAEAIIILRSAYESAIRGYFLLGSPDKVPYYKAFSELTALRNQLEVVSILEDGADERDRDAIEQQKPHIERQKKLILAEKYHELYNLGESDLDVLRALQRVTNNRNMPNFEDTRKAIKSTPLSKALTTTGFQTYNLGSQMAHSSYGMMVSMAYFEDVYPIYNEHTMYSSIFLLLCCCCELFNECGALSDSARAGISQICESFKDCMYL